MVKQKREEPVNYTWPSETGRTDTPKGGYAAHGVKPIIVPTNKHSRALLKNPDAGVAEYYLRCPELFTADGKYLTPVCKEIADAGGCCTYFESEAKPCLALIANDRQCSGMYPELVSDVLDQLDIPSSTTFDDATYLNRPKWGARKIAELREKNEDLVHSNPKREFLGIVKGSTREQVRESIHDLSCLGTQQYLFHVGPYLATRRRYDRRKAIDFGAVIRSEVNDLSVYGLGSRKSLDDFAFADGAATANYIIETRNGVFTDESGKPRSVNPGRPTGRHHYPVTDMDQEALRTFLRVKEDSRLAGLKYREQLTYSDLSQDMTDEGYAAESSTNTRGKC